jgi:hypothetical protein
MSYTEMFRIIVRAKAATPHRERYGKHPLLMTDLQKARASARKARKKGLSSSQKRAGRQNFEDGWDACKAKCFEELARLATGINMAELEAAVGDAVIPDQFMDSDSEEGAEDA